MLPDTPSFDPWLTCWEVVDLVARLSGQVTVLLSTHILADVQQVCDTVGVLRAGRLLYQGSLDELLVGRADWPTSHLVGSLHVLARGGDPGEFLPTAAVTLALGALAVAAANWRLGRRDV
jgi:ABC-type methionine transport system ATPase subunit